MGILKIATGVELSNETLTMIKGITPSMISYDKEYGQYDLSIIIDCFKECDIKIHELCYRHNFDAEGNNLLLSDWMTLIKLSINGINYIELMISEEV